MYVVVERNTSHLVTCLVKVTCLFTKQNSFCYTPLKLIFSIVTRVSVCNSIVWVLWFKALQMIWLYSPLLSYICDIFLQPLHSSFKPKYYCLWHTYHSQKKHNRKQTHICHVYNVSTKVSLLGVNSLWVDCTFIPADWSS